MELIEDKLNRIENDVKEIKTALLGDGFGNKGFMQRLEQVERHVEETKKRVWIERGIMLSLAFGWGLVIKLWDKIF
jgi:hypothetical protein